jgi:hypothetical protein
MYEVHQDDEIIHGADGRTIDTRKRNKFVYISSLYVCPDKG